MDIKNLVWRYPVFIVHIWFSMSFQWFNFRLEKGLLFDLYEFVNSEKNTYTIYFRLVVGTSSDCLLWLLNISIYYLGKLYAIYFSLVAETSTGCILGGSSLGKRGKYFLFIRLHGEEALTLNIPIPDKVNKLFSVKVHLSQNEGYV